MASKPKRTPKAKSETAAEVGAFAATFGLVKDGGWVDELEHAWKKSTPDFQDTLNKIILLCREIRPRVGGDWLKAEDDVESKCGYQPNDFPGEEPKPTPGSTTYHETLSQAAPDDCWLITARSLIDSASGDAFRSQLARLYCCAMKSGIGSLNRNAPNKEVLRGLIWCGIASSDSASIDALRQLATFSVEHKTAQAKTIAIALAFLSYETSAAALRMIATAVKRPSPKTRFNRYASHVEQRIGISSEDSAERFIPAFGLDDKGARRIEFGEHGSVELRLVNSDAVIRFFTASGSPVATPPSAIKTNHSETVAQLRESAKALEKLLATQRIRMESLFLSQPNWLFDAWKERYLDHPVVGALTRRLIWQSDGKSVQFCADGVFDEHGKSVKCQSTSQIQLWHPLEHSHEQVMVWRSRLESQSVTQPFKQAHRELYLLTDAERQTATYSNRFAAHILRQHQFRALALARGWRSPFLGNWDAGHQGIAQRDLPDHWRAEFWLYAAGDEEHEDHFQHRGLFHVVTDQVRFYCENEDAPSQLQTVPSRIFSEVMRDVDLFVGVASVGNDPTWNDGGPEGRYRDYWQSYSFGELNASAKTRKDVLQRLIPKLKIASQCSFEEKFLVVKGSIRTYKIHLGSGNIQMEPNNQYLCIVPDRSPVARNNDKVLLPFEGDRTLSVIISKAFMLADDAKIKDSSIVSQIKRS